MPLEFEALRPTEIDRLDRSKTLFLFSVGGFQDYGPHLPLGLDLIKARAWSRQWAEDLENREKHYRVILMPTLPVGIQSVTQSYLMKVRGFILRDYLVDSCRQLGKMGFRHFFCISGNLTPKQLTAIEEASMTLQKPWSFLMGSRRLILHSVSSAGRPWSEIKEQLLWPNPTEHGGSKDTALALKLCPQWVDPAYAHLPKMEMTDSGIKRFWQRLRKKIHGYWGDPAAAQSEMADPLIRTELNRSLSATTAILAGSLPGRKFRSLFSLIPSNWSYITVWILSLSLFAVFIAWMMLFFASFQSIS